jgi:hypothetical protein
MALNIYTPMAFNEALQTNVNVLAFATVIGGVPASSSAPQAAAPQAANEVQGATLSARANDAVTRIWTITNLTLVLPVLLALAVLYYAYSGILHELEGVRTQAAEIRAERTDIVKALVDQNKTLSTSNGDQAKQAIANDKAMQDALIAILREKGKSAASTK